MPKKLDLTGQRFGRLTVINESKEKLGGEVAWLCKCDCGNQTVIRAHSLRTGYTKSCGCLHKETFTSKKHGCASKNGKNRLYRIWCNMKNRCNDPHNPKYHIYGGKGIKVCEPWNDFVSFQNDMESSYLEHVKIHGERNTTIDRIDSNLDYNPDNCRWATYTIQGNNTSATRKIEFNGETHTLREWSNITGISKKNLGCRIFDYHWSIEEALTLPLGSKPTRRIDSFDTAKTKTS